MDQTEKPIPLVVVAQNIPQSLKDRHQWVLWRYDWRNNKWTKPPYQPTDRLAKTNDPATWSPFETVYGAYRDGGWDGLGFCFADGDGLTGLDLDHCYNDGLNGPAREIVEHFAGCAYVEISPSGEGVRIFCQGNPQRSGKGNGPDKWLEVYSHPSSRYLTVTGHTLTEYSGSIGDGQEALDWVHQQYFAKPEPIADPPKMTSPPVTFDDAELIDRAKSASNGDRFESLYTGEWKGYPSQSEADSALCGMLAFWTNRDPSRMDRLFRQSGLMRPKWDSHPTYAKTTIDRAVASCREGYDPAQRPSALIDLDPGTQGMREPYEIITFADLKKELSAIEWYWKPWLPKGFLVFLVAPQGAGKSSLALRVAQTIMQGIPWPDGTPYQGETGSVLWCETEHCNALNLARAEAWGVPLERLRTFRVAAKAIPQCMTAIKKEASKDDLRLIVIDALRGLHNLDENDSRIHGILQPFAQIAGECNLPMLVLHHTKKGDSKGLDATRGSGAITTLGRVCWKLRNPDPTNPNTRILEQDKNNMACMPEPLGVTWVNDEDYSPLSFGEAPKPPVTQLEKAKERLLTLLRDRSLPSREVEEILLEERFSERVIKQARQALWVTVSKTGNGQWMLSLPLPPVNK